MIKTQIQIPDELYTKVKAIAAEREMSMAEVVRRGLEYIVSVYPTSPDPDWGPPTLPKGCVRSDIDHMDLKAVLDHEVGRV